MKNITYWIIGILVLGLLVWYVASPKMSTNNVITLENATTTDDFASSTATSSLATSSTATSSNANTNAPKERAIPGYPSSWPSDVPRYPTESVKYTGGNNPQSGPIEATVVFTTRDSVRSVVNFYLSGLKANGWKITEDGAGLSNMITIRASKNRRGAGVYVVREANGRTTVTVGVNIGI